MIELTPKERSFFERQVRCSKGYLVLCWVGIIVAGTLAGTTILMGTFHSYTFVLVILILLQARANLKQYKDALLLSKFKNSVSE